MVAAEELSKTVDVREACQALGLARSSFYRFRHDACGKAPRPSPPRRSSPRALTAEQRQAVLDELHSPRFVDQAPPEVFATLLDEQTYHCSVRTMYRILSEEDEVRERRDQLRHPTYAKPQLLATAPNQIWSWDITKLLGPAKWIYFYLYVVLDIFSRYVVGWMLAVHDNASLAQRLLRESCLRQGILPDQLTIHADRGSSMKSKTVSQLLATLGVSKSHSRPRISNDNPFSESQFKTLKYRPEFPERFGSLQHALGVCRDLFHWYNHEHHHAGIALLTPATVHLGRAELVLEARHQTLLAAYRAHPERFFQGPPKRPQLPSAVWINPPTTETADEAFPEAIPTAADVHVAPAPPTRVESACADVPRAPESTPQGLRH
jgi:putative transposase